MFYGESNMDYVLMKNRKTFAISPENPSGARNGGVHCADCVKKSPSKWIEPGETAVICDIEGSGMITHLWIGGYQQHEIIIRIYWDGSPFPSVECPISAFFACAYDTQRVDRDGKIFVLNSAKMLVAPNKGYNSYWEMPFHKSCKITLENRHRDRQGMCYLISGWMGEIPTNAGYFHAVYRQEHPVCKGRSYVVLDHIEGRGFFAGVALAVGVNGSNGCWVEGEVKMFIDGEELPSVIYTGTEDYFGSSYAFGNDRPPYAYESYSGLYAGAYAILGNQTERYNAQLRFMLYRWHVVDPICFEKSIRVVMDNMGSKPRYDDYTSTAYWYMEKPARVPFVLPSDEEITMA